MFNVGISVNELVSHKKPLVIFSVNAPFYKYHEGA